MQERMLDVFHLTTTIAKMSQMSRTYYLLTLLLLLFFADVSAQFVQYSNEFLNIGAGARGMAMGNAQIASVSDGTAGYWNPAGLVYVKDGPQLNLMHSEYFAGIGKYDFANLVLPLKDKKRTLGLTLLRFAVDEIPNTIFLVQPDGSINFSNITTFSSADYAFILSLAQQTNGPGDTKFNFGLNAKIIRRQAGDFARAWGFGFDAGAQLAGDRWKVAAMAKDVTTTFNAWSFSLDEQIREVLYVTQNEIPSQSIEITAPQLVLGGEYNFKINTKVNLMVEADFDITFDGPRDEVVSSNPISIDPRLGLELSYNNVFFVRAGINNFQQVLDDKDTTNQRKIWIYQPSIGAGFKVGDVEIDYAFTNLANQSYPLYSNVFSLKVDLADAIKKQKKK
jgi:hypothetical protein